MLSVPILLIPFAIVCVGIIIIWAFEGVRGTIRRWKNELETDIRERVENNVKWKVQSEITERFTELSKEFPFDDKRRELLQQLAGISPTMRETSRKSVRDRFNRVRASCTNTY